MKLKNALALGTLSLPFIGLAADFLTTKPDVYSYTQEEKARFLEDAINNVDVEKTPEFEVRTAFIGEGFYKIFLGQYFVCRRNTYQLRHNVELGENARRLSELTTSTGEPFFTCEDIVKYVWYGGNYEYAKEMSSVIDGNGKNVFYGAQLPQFAYLGLSVDEIVNFKDTEKPNALVVYPTYDINYSGIEGAFAVKDSLKLFKLIKDAYDVKVIVASDKDELCGAIDPSKKYKLGVISGHGSKTSLTQGKPCDAGASNCDDKKYYIGTDDFELASCFDGFHQDAVIFLNSCSTAEGGDDMFNLANHMAQFALGRKIIASKVPFAAPQLEVDNIYPFQARIVVDEIDQTYVTKAGTGVINLGSIMITSGN